MVIYYGENFLSDVLLVQIRVHWVIEWWVSNATCSEVLRRQFYELLPLFTNCFLSKLSSLSVKFQLIWYSTLIIICIRSTNTLWLALIWVLSYLKLFGIHIDLNKKFKLYFAVYLTCYICVSVMVYSSTTQSRKCIKSRI